MTQFVAFDSNVEVSGAAILSFVAAMGRQILPVLAKHGITDPQPDQWYPQQAWLDSFRELAQGDFSSTLDLVNIGMKIPQSAIWPPEVQTIKDALASIDAAYHMNHRHGEIGCYRATEVGPREMEILCENPYQCDFDYGIIYGTARLYMPVGGGLIVEHDDEAPCRKRGDDSCTYHVKW
jgi:hypothetical protein